MSMLPAFLAIRVEASDPPKGSGEPQAESIEIDIVEAQPAPPLVGSEKCDRDCDADGKDNDH